METSILASITLSSFRSILLLLSPLLLYELQKDSLATWPATVAIFLLLALNGVIVGSSGAMLVLALLLCQVRTGLNDVSQTS